MLDSQKAQEWINGIGDTDLPLERARQIYREAKPGKDVTQAHKNVIRAERRLCVQYAPKYTEALLSSTGRANLKTTGELEAFEAARKQGE